MGFVRTATHRGMHENGGGSQQMYELGHGQQNGAGAKGNASLQIRQGCLWEV